MEKHCDICPWRAVYDKNKKSLFGRLWRWHINYCPGWKYYYNRLDDQKRAQIKEMYNLKK